MLESESDDTEPSGASRQQPRPRSSMMVSVTCDGTFRGVRDSGVRVRDLTLHQLKRRLVCRHHQTVCFWPAISQADKFISNEPIFQAGNLNAEDDFESEYLRYGGTVGVRNPRLVAAMRGVPPYQQHIQMNMMNRF